MSPGEVGENLRTTTKTVRALKSKAEEVAVKY